MVDANFGFNKTDVNIERRIAYEVELDRTPPLAHVLLTYTNRSIPQAAACRREDLLGLTKYQGQSYIALTQGCYWDYVRLYAPLGSRLLSVEGAQTMVDSGQEQGKSVFGTLFLVEPGQERQLPLPMSFLQLWRNRSRQAAIACWYKSNREPHRSRYSSAAGCRPLRGAGRCSRRESLPTVERCSTRRPLSLIRRSACGRACCGAVAESAGCAGGSAAADGPLGTLEDAGKERG